MFSTKVNIMKKPFYAQDFTKGQIFKLGKKTITKDEIIEFAKKYDPFPFHLDEEKASKTMFGGIISSGWQTALVWLSMMHEKFLTYETIMGSPGHDSMIWKNPVKPGDKLTGTLEILDSKISKSRPEIGFVKYKTELINQDSKQVFFTESTLIIKSKTHI